MSLVGEIRTRLHAAADPDRARAMAAYLKVAEQGTLPPLGIGRPEIRRMVQEVCRAHPPADAEALAAAARELWDDATFRDEQYAAGDLLLGRPARGRLELLDLHRHMAVTGRWWDLVDPVASRVSEVLAAHPVELAPVLRQWSSDESLWLRRVAILAPAGLGADVDLALLTDVIEPNTTDPDFFIRKAIGWALRDVSRHHPDWVRSFVDSHDLSPLSRHEALKHL